MLPTSQRQSDNSLEGKCVMPLSFIKLAKRRRNFCSFAESGIVAARRSIHTTFSNINARLPSRRLIIHRLVRKANANSRAQNRLLPNTSHAIPHTAYAISFRLIDAHAGQPDWLASGISGRGA